MVTAAVAVVVIAIESSRNAKLEIQVARIVVVSNYKKDLILVVNFN